MKDKLITRREFLLGVEFVAASVVLAACRAKGIPGNISPETPPPTPVLPVCKMSQTEYGGTIGETTVFGKGVVCIPQEKGRIIELNWLNIAEQMTFDEQVAVQLTQLVKRFEGVSIQTPRALLYANMQFKTNRILIVKKDIESKIPIDVTQAISTTELGMRIPETDVLSGPLYNPNYAFYVCNSLLYLTRIQDRGQRDKVTGAAEKKWLCQTYASAYQHRLLGSTYPEFKSISDKNNLVPLREAFYNQIPNQPVWSPIP